MRLANKMTRVANKSALKWLLLLLSLLPAAFFAYLGHFSRLMGDDYRAFSKLRELGAWDSMLYWWKNWNGSYSVSLLHGLLDPLGAERIPSIFPAIIMVLWLAGLSWIFMQALRRLSIGHSRLPIAIALAALAIAAMIKGFHTWESIYWYSASARYALPGAIFVIYLAAAFEFAGRPRSRRLMAIAALLSAAACFISAGLSELHLASQIVFLIIVLAGIPWLARWAQRRTLLIMIGAGIAATCLSASLQLFAPGTAARMAQASTARWAYPARRLSDLLEETISHTFRYIGHEETFAGFMLLFGVGLFTAMTLYKPAPGKPDLASPTFARAPFLFGLIAQLAFLPILWMHDSDSAQFFGRFSLAFLSAVAINLGMILAFVLLVALARRGAGPFRSGEAKLAALCASFLLAVIALFILTQFRSIHFRAASYIFLTALMLLIVLGWQLSNAISDSRVRTFHNIALVFSVVAIIATAAPTAVGLYVYGTVFVRTLASATMLQVISGLIWGMFTGFAIRSGLKSDKGKVWNALYRAFGLLLALAIILGILSRQIHLAPQFVVFADEWDQQHELLLLMPENGMQRAELPAYSFDLKAHIFVNVSDSHDLGWEANYYGLETIKRSAVAG